MLEVSRWVNNVNEGVQHLSHSILHFSSAVGIQNLMELNSLHPISQMAFCFKCNRKVDVWQESCRVANIYIGKEFAVWETLFVYLYLFCTVHLWSQEKCPSYHHRIQFTTKPLGFWARSFTLCHFEACNKVGFVAGVVWPSSSWEPRFLSPENSGVMKTLLWDHMGSVVKTNPFLQFFSYSISMFVVSGVSWIGSMVVVKRKLISELWY